MPFVSFEGVDGSGKGTQIERLALWLEKCGLRVVRTKEPDGGHIGRSVRGILTDARVAGSLSAVEELLLVSAARYDHVRSVIQPALARGDWVVSDRFYDSTFALQIFGLDIPTQLFEVVTQVVCGTLKPDLTVMLDLPVELALERRQSRSTRSDQDPAEMHRDFERIRSGFLQAAALDPMRCKVVDASGDADIVELQVRVLVEACGCDQFG